MKRSLFTSESVTEGHPDKICDQVSDAVLDAVLRKDPLGRVAVESLATTGSIHVAGEMTTTAYVDVQQIVRDTLKRIGYTDPRFGICYSDAGVWVAIHAQSPDIAQGVDAKKKKAQGAGDQGMMFGFACTDTPEYMPFPVIMAHRLTQRMAEVRKKGIVKKLGPDGKSQVTVLYDKGKPTKITKIVIAQQHLAEVSEEVLRKEILGKVIKPVCGRWIDKSTECFINATGRFVIGGPAGDTGVTGRKIIVDTYGGMGRHGGGAFSGKDPSKVDRSAAYMMRHVAKNIVAAGLAERCELQVSYSIGIAKPTSLNIDTFGTHRVPEETILNAIQHVFDFTPSAIIEYLKLRRPIYCKTAVYGHFGREDPEFTWEKINKVQELRRYCGLYT